MTAPDEPGRRTGTAPAAAPGSGPSAAPVADLLERMWAVRATDLHLVADAPPLIRTDGALAPVPGLPALDAEAVERVVAAVLGSAHAARLRNDGQVDFAIGWSGRARLRGNAFLQRGSAALALRMIPDAVPGIEELGLPPVVAAWANAPRGLVLVTGPTRSGKSTSLAAMIDRVNRDRAAHILTIEDPIEYVHRHRRSAVNQREVGSDTASFSDALRAALREDPDVVLIGEMRDMESIAATLTLAETGHLVMATCTPTTPSRPWTAWWTSSPPSGRRRSGCSWPRRSSGSSTSAWCRGSAAAGSRPSRCSSARRPSAT